MELGSSIHCCGICELHRIEDYEDAPEQIIHYLQSSVGGFNDDEDDDWDDNGDGGRSCIILFSSTEHTKAGQNLAKFIQENRLGRTTRTRTVLNRNSGNKITAFLWTPNWRRVLSYKPRGGWKGEAPRDDDW